MKRSLKIELKAWKAFRTRPAQEYDWDGAQRKNLIHGSSVSGKREKREPANYYRVQTTPILRK